MQSLVPRLAAIALSLLPASIVEAASCRLWEINGQSFTIHQSNGFTLFITLGRRVEQGTGIDFGTNGSISYEIDDRDLLQRSKTRVTGRFIDSRFSKTAGNLTFRVYWNNNGTSGVYYGNPSNVRPSGSGGLIADLAGQTTELTAPGARAGGSASWTAANPGLYCRSENAIFDSAPGMPPIVLKFPGQEQAPQPRTDGKVIRSTGRSSTANAQPTSFHGYWTTHTDNGGRYTLAITQKPDGTATGSFTNIDGVRQYDGTMRGTVSNSKPRTFSYTYVQPGANGNGKGVFTLSDDAMSIAGTGTHNGTLTFKWDGTRSAPDIQPR